MRCVLGIKRPSELLVLFYKYFSHRNFFIKYYNPQLYYTTLLIQFYNRRVKKVVFYPMCVSRLWSITQLMCCNIYISADRGQLKAGKICLLTETSQIISFVTVLSVDFEFVSQSLPWSHSCHHSLVAPLAQFCFRKEKQCMSRG